MTLIIIQCNEGVYTAQSQRTTQIFSVMWKLVPPKKTPTQLDLQPGCDAGMTSQLSHHPLQHALDVVGGQSTCFDRAAEACVDWSQSGGTSPRGLHKQAWAYVEINLQCGAAGALEQITPTCQRMSSGEWIRYSGPRTSLCTFSFL